MQKMNFEQFDEYRTATRQAETPRKVHYSQAYTAIKMAWVGGEDVTLLGFGATITTKVKRNGDATDTYTDVSTLRTSLQGLQGTEAGGVFMDKVFEPLANGGYPVNDLEFYASEDFKTLRLPQYMGQQVGIDQLVDGGEV